jgi:hypothetical protein
MFTHGQVSRSPPGLDLGHHGVSGARRKPGPVELIAGRGMVEDPFLHSANHDGEGIGLGRLKAATLQPRRGGIDRRQL